MDIDKIIQERKLKDEQKKREEDQRAKNKEQEMYRERARREANAEKVEQHLNEIVLPVFSEAEKKLSSSGYRFTVETQRKTDSAFGSTKQFAVGLSLEHGAETRAYLKFEGDFESVTLTPAISTGAGRSIREAALPLVAVTKEYVEKRTEEFIRAALGV